MWKPELSVELFSRSQAHSWDLSNGTCPVLWAHLRSDQEMEDVSLAEPVLVGKQRFLGAMAGCRGPGGTHGPLPHVNASGTWRGTQGWTLGMASGLLSPGGTTCGQIHEFRGKGEGAEMSPERQLLSHSALALAAMWSGHHEGVQVCSFLKASQVPSLTARASAQQPQGQAFLPHGCGQEVTPLACESFWWARGFP